MDVHAEIEMGALGRDFVETLRSLRRQPGFAVVVILTAALGIATTTAVYSLVYSILIRPYPYHEPERLVRVESVYVKQGGVRKGCSLLDIEDYRRRATKLVDIGAYTNFDAQLLSDGPPQVVAMSQLNPAALAILGVQPATGSMLKAEDDVPGGDVHKALTSYDLWQSRFGEAPGIVGRTIRTDRQTFTIVGVMPQGFGFPERTAVWTPMESWYASLTDPDRRIKRRDARWYATIARLKPGVTVAQAQAELDAVAAELEREHPRDNDGVRVALTPLREFEAGSLRPYLIALLGAVGFVLLICCANVANLLLARGAVRERDLAVRTALGAGRWRVARRLLTESATISLLGGALGVALAYAAVRGLLALIPVPLPFWMKIEVDAPVLLFSLAVVLLTGVLFGLAPAWQASKVELSGVLKDGAKGSASRGRLRSALVVGEVALSLLLLVGAGLMMQTLMRLQRVDAGFRGDGLVTARVVRFVQGTRKESAAVLSQFHDRVLASLRRVPGVESAAVTNLLPYAGTQEERIRADLSIKGRAKEETKMLLPLAGADVSPDYFRAMRIPLVRGRLFDDSDTNTSPYVVIVSERAAKTLWPGQDPIGQEVLWGALSPGNPYCRVVGVVGDVKYRAAEGENGLEFYYPMAQWPVNATYYVARVHGDSEAFAPAVRRAIEQADPNAAIVYVKTLEKTIGESLWQRRLWGVLFTVFAVLALVLAAVGLYGVMSFGVAQRTREIGIRLALGSQRGQVVGLVVRQGMTLVAGGAALGLAAAVALSRLVDRLLFGVAPFDLPTYAAVTVLLGGVALLACWLPALRAARVDPLQALRAD